MIFAVSIFIASRHTLPELEDRVDALSEEIHALQMEKEALPPEVERCLFGRLRVRVSILPRAQGVARRAFDGADKDFDDKLSFAEFNHMIKSGTVTLERDDTRDYEIEDEKRGCNKCCLKQFGKSTCVDRGECSKEDWIKLGNGRYSCSECTAPTTKKCDGAKHCCNTD